MLSRVHELLQRIRPPSGRPEVLRRHTLAANARIIIAASAIAGPFAIHALFHGLLLPFMLAMSGLAVGLLALALCQRQQYERAAAAQVYGMFIAGFMLTLNDPAIADFGLATALLAPVHASLLTRSPVKKRSWVILVVLVGIASLNAMGLLAWPEAYRADYGVVGALVFALAAFVVAHSANRLNSAFEVYEKAQINAYRHLIEHVQDAVMRFSAEGQVLFASRSSERLFGCRRYELTGPGLLDRIHVLDRPVCLTAFDEANRGASRTIEVRMRYDADSNGAGPPRFVWVEAALSPVIDRDSAADRHEVVALLRDVTERHDMENEMRRARLAAEEASSAKSRFLAMIGHELRTPLNAIVGFSEMMSSGIGGELPPTHREYAGLIRQSGEHLIEVVRMLLDMSRIEAGKFELQTEPIQPHTLIEPCLRMVDVPASARGIVIHVDVPKSLPLLTADERACRQILINLLSNAIKFSQEGGRVDVTLRQQGPSLRISVVDRGIGMSPETVSHIGEPFYQNQEGLARRYEGTGLGLSIVKGLVELHDGSLDVRSVEGEGTTMSVLLPLNGPATKLVETSAITRIRPDPVAAMPEWRQEQRKAQ